jgi:hypothetical protein
MADEKNVININGTVYSPDDLSQEQNYMIAQVKDLQVKTSQAKFNLDQLQVSLNYFTNKVIESIEDLESNLAYTEDVTSEVMPKQSVN